MKYTVKVLTLYKDLYYTTEENLKKECRNTGGNTAGNTGFNGSSIIDKSGFLYRYTSAVAPKELTPRLSRFLTKPRFAGYALVQHNPLQADEVKEKNADGVQTKGTGIPAGLYLFLQAVIPQKENTDIRKKRLAEYRRAAEHLHTEALWREIDFCDDTVYIRTLKEGDAEVFQLFRKIRRCKTD